MLDLLGLQSLASSIVQAGDQIAGWGARVVSRVDRLLETLERAERERIDERQRAIIEAAQIRLTQAVCPSCALAFVARSPSSVALVEWQRGHMQHFAIVVSVGERQHTVHDDACARPPSMVADG